MDRHHRSEATDPLTPLAVGGAIAGAVGGVALGGPTTVGAVVGAVLGSWTLAAVGAYLIEPVLAARARRRVTTDCHS